MSMPMWLLVYARGGSIAYELVKCGGKPTTGQATPLLAKRLGILRDPDENITICGPIIYEELGELEELT